MREPRTHPPAGRPLVAASAGGFLRSIGYIRPSMPRFADSASIQVYLSSAAKLQASGGFVRVKMKSFATAAAVVVLVLSGCGSSGGSGSLIGPSTQTLSNGPSPTSTPSATPTPSREDVDRVFTNVTAALHTLGHLDNAGSLSAIASQYTQAATGIQRASQIVSTLQGVDTGPITDALSALADGLNSSSNCLTNYLQEVTVNPAAANPCQGPLDQIGPLATAAGKASAALVPYSSFTLAQIQQMIA